MAVIFGLLGSSLRSAALFLTPPANVAMPTIKFTKEKKEIQVPVGANLRQEAMKAGINLYQGINGFGTCVNKVVNCHGLGACGTCRVNITKGMENASPMGTYEKLRFKGLTIPEPVALAACFAYLGNETTMRLACLTTVNGDMEVETGPELNLFGDNFFS
jgi:ferredoxin